MGFGLRNRTLPSNMAGVVVPESSSSRRDNITVESNCDPHDVHFSIKRDCPLRKLINAYIELKNLHGFTIEFVYADIKPERTSEELGIEDGNVIYAVLSMIGGGYGRSHKM
ncbi:hypothetical protein MKW94_022774 [Papaver nudicaule]|uniref:Rad60/SUMO-like domain-containing protein n=1 Tax=Papaver nudicaule TaxID=74823 RepID=A0AA41W0Z4_PAPNU|nr:hypothetical protein [Papaver nudicaule]